MRRKTNPDGTYRFPSMLGPYAEWPEGSWDRAMRVSSHLQTDFDEARKNGVRRLSDAITGNDIARVQPWNNIPMEGQPVSVATYFDAVGWWMGLDAAICTLRAHGAKVAAAILEHARDSQPADGLAHAPRGTRCPEFPNGLARFVGDPPDSIGRAMLATMELQSALRWAHSETRRACEFVKNELLAERPWENFPTKGKPIPVVDYLMLVAGVSLSDLCGLLEACGETAAARALESDGALETMLSED